VLALRAETVTNGKKLRRTETYEERLMRLDRVGGVLLVTGAIVGVVAAVGVAVGFEPSQLPPKLLDIAAYKLTFGAAAVLLAIGAIVRRHGLTSDNATSSRTRGPLSHEKSSSLAELPPPPIGRDFADDRAGRKPAEKVEAKAPREL
jgi:hypothetical protein